jgi:hypothetical protein
VTKRRCGKALTSATPYGFPRTGTSYLQCGPCDQDLGEPRRYMSYEEWLAKSGSQSINSAQPHRARAVPTKPNGLPRAKAVLHT